MDGNPVMIEPTAPEQSRKGTPPIPASTPTVPDHELIGLIGRGSSGEVWLARNALGRYRAVKVVYRHTFQHHRPFEREFNGILNFEPVSRLHDGLVDILQVGWNEADGYFYCVMELADDIATGQEIVPETYMPRTLASDIFQRKRLPISTCIRIGSAVAGAMSFLHGRGLIHRDVKPSNIIFVNGEPKLADIGLVAELSEAKSYVGTDGFIPPEGPGSAQSDIYSLGKVLYEISTGKDRHDYPELPTDFEDNMEARNFVRFNKIILKACRADPRQRYESAEDLMNALRGFRFSIHNPRLERIYQRVVFGVTILGLIAAACVYVDLIWRFIRLLK